MDSIRGRSDQHAHGLGLTDLSEPRLYINGQNYPTTGSLAVQLMKASEDTLPMLQRSVYYRQISDHSNVQDALIKLFKPTKRVLPAVLESHLGFAPCTAPPSEIG